MTREEFKRKMKSVYPDKEIEFGVSVRVPKGHLIQWAKVEGFTFESHVGSTQIHMYWDNGNYAGRAYAVEEA